MGLLHSLLLGALGVGVAMANTQDQASTSEELTAELSRRNEHRKLQEAAAKKGEKPSQMLGLHEWIALMQELGWWDEHVTEAEFWDRLSAWDAQSEALSAASSPQHPPTSETCPSGPESGTPSREVPLLGVDPEMA